jgi:feruloyl esterase
LQKAALDSCDALDGVKDGLIEDPRKCHIDLAKLQCTGGDVPDCLTPAQRQAVQMIYGGPVSARTGEQIYPGYEPGTEANPGGWSAWIVGPMQAQFGNSLFSQAVYENAPWDWRTADLDRDLAFANEKVGWILNSYSPDLRSFRAHGGKLIQYHGWGDAAIAPRDSIAYYNKVEAFLKQFPDPRSRASTRVQDFYRLFMVPGMGHCGGGVGPNHFGNDDIQDAEHDLLLALDRWVMEGVAPDRIVATGERVSAERDNPKPVKFTRPLCPYPQVAHYQGAGDTNEAGHFACANEAVAGRP